MKKVLSVLVIAMMLSVGLVFATPADTIKDGDPTIFDTGDGGMQAFVNNELGLYHCVLKPMYDKDGELIEQKPGWVAYGPYWMKCNAFGPNEE